MKTSRIKNPPEPSKKEEGLTMEEMKQAQELARLQFQEIKHLRAFNALIEEAYYTMYEKEIIPCNYTQEMDKKVYTPYPSLAFLLQVIKDIEEGNIVLKNWNKEI